MSDIMMKGLGRRVAHDSRDANYPMRLALRPTAIPKHRYYGTPVPLPLDQGQTGTCVGHAWWGFLRSDPLRCNVPMTPFDLYKGIILKDEWSENDAEANGPNSGLQFGSSVRAGAKHLQELGHVKSYVWSRSADEMAAWLLSGHGTIVLGTTWFWDMGAPDKKGFVHLTGGEAGGHAYLCIGYSRIMRAFRCLNSWGPEFGVRGRFWLAHDDMNQLVREDDGEACAAVEQVVVPEVR